MAVLAAQQVVWTEKNPRGPQDGGERGRPSGAEESLCCRACSAGLADAATPPGGVIGRQSTARGSAVGRAARSLAPTPPVELTAENIQKLHDLHPAADLPESPIYLLEALQIDVETLDKVRRATPRGSAAGPSSTTYEHIIAALRTTTSLLRPTQATM